MPWWGYSLQRSYHLLLFGGACSHFLTSPEDPGHSSAPTAVCVHWPPGRQLALCTSWAGLPGSRLRRNRTQFKAGWCQATLQETNKRKWKRGKKKIHQLLNAFWVSKYFAWCELSPETWPGRVMEQGPGVAFYANLEG